MALFDIKTQTTVGRNYLTQAVAGSKIIWDGIKVSTDYFSNPVGLADLTKIVITSPVDYAEQVSNEQFDIGGHVDSSKVHSDTIIKTWGLYGHVGSDNSQLLAVLSSQSGQTLYANTRDVQTIKETFSLVFPNPSNTPISFVVSNSGFALDDNVVHTTGDETARGVKNFQDGVKSGGKNVVTQNGDDTINVANGLTNNVIEPVDRSKIKDSIIQASLSSSNNIDNLENDGRYPFDSVTIVKIDPNNKISGYLDQSTNGSTIIQGTVYTVGTTKYVKYRSKSNGAWSDWNTSASIADMEVKLANKVNVADMRKPASDVAGIEEVNTKQDKISYTPADDSKVVHNSAIDPSTIVKRILTADDDVLTLDPGTYYTWSAQPKNYPTSAIPWGRVVVKMVSPDGLPSDTAADNKVVEAFDTHNHQVVNIYQGNPPKWSGWQVPNSDTMASKSDVNTATANKADDSKVVHSSDMRKPASDVAGIDEVNAKQDKIAYTPADDSKVWHSSLTQLNSTDMNTVFTAGFYELMSGTNGMPNADAWTIYQVIPLSILNGVQVAYGTNNTILGMRSWNNNPSHITFTSWVQFADDSKVVHSTDMRKPASDVAGIEEVNTKQDKLTITPADDSKVVHNSGDETIGGTKTFTNPIKGTIDGITYRYSSKSDDLDTSYMNDSVVFVKGNAVLHAPAGTDGTWAIVRNYNSNGTNGAQSYYDTNHGELYVRTRNSTSTYTPWIQVADDSKVAHLSGANNFDTVPTVDNNPLLLASSLPSDLARTGQAQTFTAAQTFSIAPTITDASQDKGDNQAATMADLKSVEKSAWHQLDSSKVTGGAIINSFVLYKIDEPNKKIYLSFTVMRDLSQGDSDPNVYFDFSGIINKILSVSGEYTTNNTLTTGFAIKASGNKVVVSSSGSSFLGSLVTASNSLFSVTQPTINYDKLLI